MKILFFKLECSKCQRRLVMLVENQNSQHDLSLGPHLSPRGPKVSKFWKKISSYSIQNFRERWSCWSKIKSVNIIWVWGPIWGPGCQRCHFFFKFSKFQSEWLLRGPCPLVLYLALYKYSAWFDQMWNSNFLSEELSLIS